MYFLKWPFAAVKILCSSINRIRLVRASLFLQMHSNLKEIGFSAGDFLPVKHLMQCFFLFCITFLWFQAALCKFVKLNLLWRSRGGFQFRWLRPCFLIQESFRLCYLRVHKDDEVKSVLLLNPAPVYLIKIGTWMLTKNKYSTVPVFWSFNYHFLSQ